MTKASTVVKEDAALTLAKIRETAAKMDNQELRFLVDTYYRIQDDRKAKANQRFQLQDGVVYDWIVDQSLVIEKKIGKVLGECAKQRYEGRWAMDITGIGPIITAALIAYIDIEKAPVVANVFSYAGVNPKQKWYSAKEATDIMAQFPEDKPLNELLVEVANKIMRKPQSLEKTARSFDKNEKLTRDNIKKAITVIPWNKKFKTLVWKIGDSFVKSRNSEKSFYGPIYWERKQYEIERNERGEYREQALERAKHVGKNTEAYKTYSQGKLTPDHINNRAMRYAAKLFLSHFHTVSYWNEKGELPPAPYAIVHQGHAHYIPPPNFPPAKQYVVKFNGSD